ncbi:hypothetical protein [Jannaschia formosa]|uniref:hypothetical protein n=1 Tax=Jannaschia formosa TaxID=2259592 RepID=UPI000E1BF564|nr:hypothetical protein [Jannaschia formosa]TFL19780.1 hypothetical protein DR046_00035 [Jannaschia formosa]
MEGRELDIENELEEPRYTLEDLHDALNTCERKLNYSEGEWVSCRTADPLAVIPGDPLGKGDGAGLEFERDARSIGPPRDALHRTMVAWGKRAGYDLPWVCGAEARRAAVEEEEPASEG